MIDDMHSVLDCTKRNIVCFSVYFIFGLEILKNGY